VVLSPVAWLKLQLFLYAGETEVGGFALSSADDLLYLEEFLTVRQRVSPVTVAFDDAAVADHFDAASDRGISPGRCGRVWVHTHPGHSPFPSSVDEETFARVFGGCDWAVMLIVSRTLETYARLTFSAGPGGSLLLPVEVDWAAWPQLLLERSGELGGLFEAWMDEYGRNIHPAADPPYLGDLLSLDTEALGWERRDLPQARHTSPAWTARLWREEAVYGVQEELALDEAFAACYPDMEGR
jgi:hypothetical protein